MLIPRDRRHAILIEEWLIPRREVTSAIRENIRSKNQRVRTISNLSSERIDKILESAKRKLVRALFFRQKPSAECNKMMEQAGKAAASVERVASDGRVRDFAPRRYSNPDFRRERDHIEDLNKTRHSTGGGVGLISQLQTTPISAAE
jgi:hypothetical protein